MTEPERSRNFRADLCLFKRDFVLVLDEATNAIDVSTEREIFERLRALVPRPTNLVIAHRAESLALCDRVLRMEGGRCAGGETERLSTVTRR